MTRPNMVMRSLRVPEALWTAAMAEADKRHENLSDVIRSALESYMEGGSGPSFRPGRWWRVLAPDGSLWLETSRESVARQMARPGDTLQREYVTEPEDVWVTVP